MLFSSTYIIFSVNFWYGVLSSHAWSRCRRTGTLLSSSSSLFRQSASTAYAFLGSLAEICVCKDCIAFDFELCQCAKNLSGKALISGAKFCRTAGSILTNSSFLCLIGLSALFNYVSLVLTVTLISNILGKILVWALTFLSAENPYVF